MRNLTTGKTTTRSWRTVKAKQIVSRKGAGSYEVTTRVTCDQATLTRTDRVNVRRKTDASTISRGEYKRIKAGMSLEKVKRITGLYGQVVLHDSERTVRLYNRRGYNDFAAVIFQGGKVSDKEWS